jgi:Zn finger protein HypA/HybF involved in hydrogenase expression
MSTRGLSGREGYTSAGVMVWRSRTPSIVCTHCRQPVQPDELFVRQGNGIVRCSRCGETKVVRPFRAAKPVRRSMPIAEARPATGCRKCHERLAHPDSPVGFCLRCEGLRKRELDKVYPVWQEVGAWPQQQST